MALVCSLYTLACSGDPSADRNGPGSGPHAGAAGEDPFGNSTAFRDGGRPVFGDGAAPEVEEPGECGSTSVEARPVVIEEEVMVESEVTVVEPVALYIMFDKSISMGQSNLWEPAVDAMKAFVTDEDSARLSVGLQYFPRSGGSCSTGAGYDTPAVDVAELPGNADMLSASLDGQSPNGNGTPMEGALRGVTEFCKDFQAAQADMPCIAVLVTDGIPQFASGCLGNNDPDEYDELAAIAGDAYAAGVTTFAVGLQGADFDLLDEIARQGGAPDCDPDGPGYACDVSGGAEQLADALISIRDTVVEVETRTEVVTRVDERRLPCEWELPAVPEGQTFDHNKVNIKLTSEQGERTLGRVSSPERCVANGWHFDDAESPARILACPETCEEIEALPSAQIDILLGCASVLIE